MPALSKASLKSIWVNYFQPTSSNFSDLIDSWTDYYVSLQAIGQAVSAGSTGLVNITSTSTVSFLAVGATGQDLAATGTAASARSVLGLGALATQSTVSAANIDAASVSAAAIVDNSITLAKLSRVGTTGQSLISGGTGTDAAYAWTGLVQRVVTASSTVVSGTATIPLDDTIPQVTEGTQFLAVTITPRSAASTLVVEAQVYFSNLNNATITGAVHLGSAADAIAAIGMYVAAGADDTMIMRHSFVANTVAAIPVQIRLGGNVATTIHMNGSSAGARRFGGVAASSISVTEIAP
jgi:hypothetical protein